MRKSFWINVFIVVLIVILAGISIDWLYKHWNCEGNCIIHKEERNSF
ncbi:MAG: hypothetical protein N2645_00740 [Clostridia bacterium]|nr:hypothetical protein [Clostridia bacterium]